MRGGGAIAFISSRMSTTKHRRISCWYCRCPTTLFFFFNDTAPTDIYTLSLHDALPISRALAKKKVGRTNAREWSGMFYEDRKSTRLNSSHMSISYAVFCLKKKKKDVQIC